MTDASAPFDGNSWSEAGWYRHMPAAMPSGVIGTVPASAATGPLAYSSSGLNVTVGVGNANVGGAGFSRTGTPAATAVTANTNLTLARRDRIVLRRDLATHNVTVVLIQGTPAGTPVAPDITRDETTFDLKLFSFLVPANSGTTITGVVDERVWVEDGTESEPVATLVSARGTATPTSNGSGNVTVTHGLGVVPDFVDVTFRTAGVRAYSYSVTAATSTTFTYRVYYDNAVAASNDHSIYWRVEAEA